MGTQSLHLAHAPRGSLPEELDVSPPAPHRPESHPAPGITLHETLVPDSPAHVHDLACLVRQQAGDIKASSHSRSCTAQSCSIQSSWSLDRVARSLYAAQPLLSSENRVPQRV